MISSGSALRIVLGGWKDFWSLRCATLMSLGWMVSTRGPEHEDCPRQERCQKADAVVAPPSHLHGYAAEAVAEQVSTEVWKENKGLL